MVVLARANVCAIALIDFPSSLSFKMVYFSLMDSSLVCILVIPFYTTITSLQWQNSKLKLRVDIERYLLFE